MTEEEYFRKHYPDFCYSSGKPLSPYWDLFQDGVEFGERQSEKKIEELEKENAELRNNGFTVSAMTEQQLKVALEKGEQLDKENAELSMKRKAERKIFQGIVEKKNDQLAQAKEIIKELIEDCKSFAILSDCEPTSKEIEQAEQFIREIEK